jgi:hypothetical protein
VLGGHIFHVFKGLLELGTFAALAFSTTATSSPRRALAPSFGDKHFRVRAYLAKLASTGSEQTKFQTTTNDRDNVTGNRNTGNGHSLFLGRASALPRRSKTPSFSQIMQSQSPAAP